MNNVFVTNFKDQNYLSERTEYYTEGSGYVIPITEGTVNVFYTDGLKTSIRHILNKHNYNPEDDFILIAGNAIIAAVVMKVVATDYPDRMINVLLYDHNTKDYVLRSI